MLTEVKVEGLHKRFGPIHAVRGISFFVTKGNVLGFLGPNGAGKSTTMKVITGFLEPTEGSVSVCGHDVEQDPVAVKSALGYLPEGAPVYGEMTVMDFLEFIAMIRALKGHRKKERIEKVISDINLESVLYQNIETLSKGYKRRVGLAQAILHDPAVLILDEPTDGLDPNQKHEVRTLIKSMAREKVVIISTHILEEVDAVCTRAIVIAAGKILFDDSPEMLRNRSDRGDIDHAFREITMRYYEKTGEMAQS